MHHQYGFPHCPPETLRSPPTPLVPFFPATKAYASVTCGIGVAFVAFCVRVVEMAAKAASGRMPEEWSKTEKYGAETWPSLISLPVCADGGGVSVGSSGVGGAILANAATFRCAAAAAAWETTEACGCGAHSWTLSTHAKRTSAMLHTGTSSFINGTSCDFGLSRAHQSVALVTPSCGRVRAVLFQY